VAERVKRPLLVGLLLRLPVAVTDTLSVGRALREALLVALGL
jgi:hypothetical protein